MASTKTKKVNEYQVEKQRHAQLVNTQKAKNERMFALLGLRHLYPLLNDYGKMALAKVRISATLIQAAPECNDQRSKEAVEYIKDAFKSFEMNTEVTLLNGNKITVREFRTTLSSIFLNFLTDGYDVGLHTPQIKKEIQDLFLKYVDTWKGVNDLCNDFFDDVCTHISSLKHGIYYPKEGIKDSRNKGVNGSWSTIPVYTFKVEKPMRKLVNFDGKKREVYQMGFPEIDKGIRWTTVASERLGMPHGQSYPCYIQQHAIKRLVERIGIFSESVTVFQACLSLEQGRVLRIPGSDAYHIEFKILNLKLGYLVAILVDDILVVKTFIFITQSGSPEGKRIETTTGIKKDDKDFIGMGTLKGFLSEDVANNRKMAFLLEKVGCADLLKAYEVFSQKVNIKGMQATGKIITQYLDKSWEYSNLESIESYTSDYLAIVPVLPPQPMPDPSAETEEYIEEEEVQEAAAPLAAPATQLDKPISKKKRILYLLLLPFILLSLPLLHLLAKMLLKKINKEQAKHQGTNPLSRPNKR